MKTRNCGHRKSVGERDTPRIGHNKKGIIKKVSKKGGIEMAKRF